MPMQYNAPYTLLTNESAYNMTQGIQTLFIYANDISNGLFISLFLIIVWATVAGGLYVYKIRNTQQQDIVAPFAVGGFITSIITILLMIIPGLIETYIWIIVFALTIISVIALFMSKKEG